MPGMSEHILTILLSELSTLRIRCKACGQVVETSIDKLTRQTSQCRLCQADLGAEGLADAFRKFAAGLQALQKDAPEAELSFILRDQKPHV
jgi:hypothetical protein